MEHNALRIYGFGSHGVQIIRYVKFSAPWRFKPLYAQRLVHNCSSNHDIRNVWCAIDVQTIIHVMRCEFFRAGDDDGDDCDCDNDGADDGDGGDDDDHHHAHD